MDNGLAHLAPPAHRPVRPAPAPHSFRSDPFGLSLEARELAGGGSIRLDFTDLADETRVLELEVMLLGEDGSAVAIRNLDQAVEVPVGRYALGSVRLRVAGSSSQPWSYVFSRSSRPDESQWYAVADGEQVALGSVEFVAQSSQWDTPLKLGDWLTVTPRLTTRDGLLLNQCGPGLDDIQSSNRHSANLQLVAPSPGTDNGKPVSNAHSGFA